MTSLQSPLLHWRLARGRNILMQAAQEYYSITLSQHELGSAISMLRDLHTEDNKALSPKVIWTTAEYRLTELGELAINLPKAKFSTSAAQFLLPLLGGIATAGILFGIYRRRRGFGSLEIFALALVTLTPSSLARATISIRFLEETACAILNHPISTRSES